jgi:RHS repeat-associated protein
VMFMGLCSLVNYNAYRYGFNGKEKDDEGMGGGGSTYDYGFRIYNPALGKFLSVDPLAASFPWWSPFAFAGNTPIQAIDLDGLEIFYAQSGQKLGVYGTSTEIRVVNQDQVATATTELAAYSNAVKTNPAATNEFLGGSLTTTGSVAFADYFTEVADVTGGAVFQTYTMHGDCKKAADAQCTLDNVTPKSRANAKDVLIDNALQPANKQLTADPIRGAIYIQTELNAGRVVEVGVAETKTDGTIQNSGNHNVLTGHFLVITGTNSDNGVKSFTYLDNARATRGNRPAENRFIINTTSGAMVDDTDVPPQTKTKYEVSEVR